MLRNLHRRPLQVGGRWSTGLAIVLLGLLAVWPLWFGVGGFLDVFRFGGVDFKAYYAAGLRVRAGLPLYGSGYVDAVPAPRSTRFLYPPVVAVPFAALTVLAPLAARVVFLVAQFGALWAGVLALLRSFDVDVGTAEALVAGWLLAGFQPVVFLLRTGNVTGFVAALLCLSAAVTVAPDGPDRPLLGGALAAVAALPKPYVAAAGAHLLADSRRLVGGAVATTVAFGLGLALFGPATHLEYVDVLVAGNSWGAPRPDRPLPWHFRPYAAVPGLRVPVRTVLLGVAASTALVGGREEQEAVFALGCVAVPLVARGADTLTLVVALPGLLVAGLREVRADGAPGLVLAGGLGVQTSVYSFRLLVHYGPTHVPVLPWAAMRRIAVVQPATAGLLCVFALCAARVWTPRLRSFGGSLVAAGANSPTFASVGTPTDEDDLEGPR